MAGGREREGERERAIEREREIERGREMGCDCQRAALSAAPAKSAPSAPLPSPPNPVNAKLCSPTPDIPSPRACGVARVSSNVDGCAPRTQHVNWRIRPPLPSHPAQVKHVFFLSCAARPLISPAPAPAGLRFAVEG